VRGPGSVVTGTDAAVGPTAVSHAEAVERRPGAADRVSASPGRALPRRVHPGLIRPVLYAGVERPVIALEATVAIGLVATVGPRLVTLLAVGLIIGVVHPLMVWLTSKDPLATGVYVRSLRWRDYYPPHGGIRARGQVRPTLPRA
jgi:type IV secretory pathway TrbD component